MQTPICEVCLKSEFLCKACQEKLEKCEINKSDIDVSRFLFKLSQKMKSIKNVRIVKVIDCGVLIIVTGRGDAPKLVGKGGSVVKRIAKQYKKPVRILEEAPNFKDFVKELIYPAPVYGINTLYRNAEEIYRVRVPSFQKGHIMIKPEDFSKVISEFFNLKAELIFES
jgi:transcription antitermination factor NusA-like protein